MCACGHQQTLGTEAAYRSLVVKLRRVADGHRPEKLTSSGHQPTSCRRLAADNDLERRRVQPGGLSPRQSGAVRRSPVSRWVKLRSARTVGFSSCCSTDVPMWQTPGGPYLSSPALPERADPPKLAVLQMQDASVVAGNLRAMRHRHDRHARQSLQQQFVGSSLHRCIHR